MKKQMIQMMRPSNADPRNEYIHRFEKSKAAVAACESRHRQIGNARLAVFLIAAALGWTAFRTQAISGWWLIAPLLVFILLMAWHSRILLRRQRSNRSVNFYERGLARIEERWQGLGEQGSSFNDPSHPYAQDLDLFGAGSLFELLSSARTHAGEQTLASWLKNPTPIETTRSRQSAVDELRSCLDLREDLAVLGTDVETGLDPDPLIKWGHNPPTPKLVLLRIAAGLTSILTLASLAFWAITGQELWFFVTALIEIIFVYSRRNATAKALGGAEKASRDLQLLSLVLARIEREQFKTDPLKKLLSTLIEKDLPPSRLISRLNFLLTLLDSRRNPFFAPIAFILLWEIQLSFFVEDWRRAHGAAIEGWISTVAQFEALSSLAGYAYEHPNDPFPELCDNAPCFEGEGLGHPLLPENKCVRNNVNLTGQMQVLIVSGSNMSGKSTFLRTIGINAVLAQAGAPVRAHRLRISPLVLGASIRIMDSLQEGTSRFYAEITRLRKIVEQAEGPVPLLFLLDELLNGTNSHDRLIGAEAIVAGLVRRGAIGLLTTHDLALAHITESTPLVANVHFEDHLEDGKMAFDYRLQPGVVKKSNALELMKSIGLEV
jgi:hypothetical protein